MIFTPGVIEQAPENGLFIMGQYHQHVFVCTYGPYCPFDGDTEQLLKRLKERVAASGLNNEIRINRSGCLNQCGHGPNLVVYPDGVWYAHVQPSDADEIFESHLLHGEPVQRLLHRAPPGNNKDTAHYPPSVRELEKQEKVNDKRRAALYADLRAAAAASASASETPAGVSAAATEHDHAPL